MFIDKMWNIALKLYLLPSQSLYIMQLRALLSIRRNLYIYNFFIIVKRKALRRFFYVIIIMPTASITTVTSHTDFPCLQYTASAIYIFIYSIL